MISYQALFPFLLGLLALSARGQRQCYFPDRKVAVNDTACTADAVSVCCQQGASCLDYGLCYLPSASAVGGFIRGSCTDESWASPDCPQYCRDDIPGGIFNSLSDAGVVSCGGNKFCCESDNITTCDCQTGNGTFTLAGSFSALTTIGSSSTTTSSSTSSSSTTSSVISSTPSSSTISSTTTSASPSSTTSSTATSTTSTIATSSSTASSSGSSGSSEAVKVGIGVGVPLGVALLVVIGIFLWRGRRRPPAYPSQVQYIMPSNDNKPLAWSLPSQGGTYELPLTERPGGSTYELPVR